MQPWKQTKTGTEVPRLTFLRRLDSGLGDAEQEPPDELHSLTEDDLPSEIPSIDGAWREIEECLRLQQQAPGPHSRSDAPSDAA